MSCSAASASIAGITLVLLGVMVAAQPTSLQLHIHASLRSRTQIPNAVHTQAVAFFNQPGSAQPTSLRRQSAKFGEEDVKANPLSYVKASVFFTGVVVLLGQAFQHLRRKLQSNEHVPLAAKALATVTLASLGSGAVADPAAAFTLPVNEQQLYNYAWKVVSDSFIDKSFNGQDWQKVHDEALAQPLKTREETYAVIRSSLDSLGDPFTRLLDPPQYDNIKRRLTGRLTGVGLEIVPIFDAAGNKMKVVDRTLEGPADKAGIKDFDVILGIDGEPIGSQTQWLIANKIVGDRNSQVTLTVQTPGEEPRDVQLTRDNVTFQAVKYALCDGVANQSWQDKPIEHLGYIRVPSFNYSTAADFNKALKELTGKGADGVVIDLRSDTGGSLNAAYEMANSILPSGEIVRVIGADGKMVSAQVRGRAIYPDIPITLLVDDHTASSSEVLAAALKAAGRAAIAGEQTFGKGIIQDIKVLPDGSAVFVTKERYLTPNNEEIDKVGITPTVAVNKDLLNTKTGLRTEPSQFCEDIVRVAPPLFGGEAPPPGGPHADVDLNTLSAFC